MSSDGQSPFFADQANRAIKSIRKFDCRRSRCFSLKLTTWLILLGAILAEVAATLSLKGSQSHPALYVVVAVGYAIAFACLTLVLKRGLALGVAYGIWGAGGVALTAVLSWAVFDESLTPVMLGGIVLVIAGVLLVETGSTEESAP